MSLSETAVNVLDSMGANGTAVVAELWRAHEEVMANLPIPTAAGIAEAWAQPGVTGALGDFIRAVDWSEPFFRYLAAFHVLTYALVWRGGRSTTGALVSLVVLMVLVLSASHLNDLGSAHHTDIFRKKTLEENQGNLLAPAHTNYFDASGIFISAVFSAPLVLLAFATQIRLFAQAGSMMVTIKKGQLREQRKQPQVDAGGEGKTQGKKKKKADKKKD